MDNIHSELIECFKVYDQNIEEIWKIAEEITEQLADDSLLKRLKNEANLAKKTKQDACQNGENIMSPQLLFSKGIKTRKMSETITSNALQNYENALDKIKEEANDTNVQNLTSVKEKINMFEKLAAKSRLPYVKFEAPNAGGDNH